MKAPASRLGSSPIAAAPARSAILARTCACGNHTGGGTCSSCAAEAETRHRRLARLPAGSSDQASASEPVPPIVHDVLHDTGEPMPGEVRAFMEPRFGADFSDVRLHTDGAAAQSSQAVSARAYTVGSHIVFGSGQYAPASSGGRRLLAHELTHVVQQRMSGGDREVAPEAISDPHDACEHEAVATAHHVLSSPAGDAGGNAPIAESGAGVQRDLLGGALVVGGIAAAFATAYFTGLTDREHFKTDELLQYLDGLAKRRKIEGHRDSDNKARDVVRHWQRGDAKINVTAGHKSAQGSLSAQDLRRLLIQEMLDGVTAGDDEEAILTILTPLSDDELLELLQPGKGLNLNQLTDKINHANNRRLNALFDAKFPQNSKVRQQQAPDSGCSGAQAVMIFQARQEAKQRLDFTVAAMQNPADPAVQRGLDCYFHGATPADVATITSVLAQAQIGLTTREYFCHSITRRTSLGVAATTCEGGGDLAVSFTDRSRPEVRACPQFFDQGPITRAITLIHEAAHFGGANEDFASEVGCGFPLRKALDNAESYALFASSLFDRAPAAAAPPVAPPAAAPSAPGPSTTVPQAAPPTPAPTGAGH